MMAVPIWEMESMVTVERFELSKESADSLGHRFRYLRTRTPNPNRWKVGFADTPNCESKVPPSASVECWRHSVGWNRVWRKRSTESVARFRNLRQLPEAAIPNQRCFQL